MKNYKQLVDIKRDREAKRQRGRKNINLLSDRYSFSRDIYISLKRRGHEFEREWFKSQTNLSQYLWLLLALLTPHPTLNLPNSGAELQFPFSPRHRPPVSDPYVT